MQLYYVYRRVGKRTRNSVVYVSARSSKAICLFLLLIWATQLSFCQTVVEKSTIQLSFSAPQPKATGVAPPMPPSDFIVRDLLDAMKAANQDLPYCFNAIDWVSFRLTAPNTIDSIRVSGEFLPNYLTDFFESRVLASQPYWQYITQNTRKSIRIRLPVSFSNYCLDSREPKPSQQYLDDMKKVDSVSSQPRRFVRGLKAMQESESEVMLWPIYFHRVK
ncbi:hypothetical protein FAES_0739 [Fibrella aestuarina BUZ 2]|uniref:Uncharacterized protein n=1 Tax=Fibrella aestuarina BUZ 2 TaxID=1166018 RepID=I0K3P7_9BACT|nr:hypothetical protein [Fibrella aestuarina]CCG98750.1 hypothetical protein FAES_0739 [Fibrella aestuarina BUZ 2]